MLDFGMAETIAFRDEFAVLLGRCSGADKQHIAIHARIAKGLFQGVAEKTEAGAADSDIGENGFIGLVIALDEEDAGDIVEEQLLGEAVAAHRIPRVLVIFGAFITPSLAL